MSENVVGRGSAASSDELMPVPTANNKANPSLRKSKNIYVAIVKETNKHTKNGCLT